MPENQNQKQMQTSLHESAAIKSVLSDDPYLTPYKDTIVNRFVNQTPYKTRHHLAAEWLNKIDKYEGGMDKFTRGYETMGFAIKDDCIVYREWVRRQLK